MRQQLISWLIEDVAPEIRRSKDPEGAILKFASEHNLAESQVQAMGQLYNTAKTLRFFEKEASRRGHSFPILDVDHMVGRFLEAPTKQASIPFKYEFDDQDNGCGLDLPACFNGLTHNVYREEKAAPAQVFDNPVKQARTKVEASQIVREFAEQARFEFQEDMRKAAAEIVTALRSNADYQFAEVEADAWAILGDEIKPVMDKLAKYCKHDGWPVTRADKPSQDKLVQDPDGLMDKISSVLDNLYRIKAAEEILAPSAGAAADGGKPLTAAPLATDKEAVILKGASAVADKIDPSKIESQQEGGGKGQFELDDFRALGGLPPKGKSQNDASGPGESPKSTGSGRGSFVPPDKGMKAVNNIGSSESGSTAGVTEKYLGEANTLMDRGAGGIARMLEPGLTGALFNTNNRDQQRVDTDMRDVRHVAILQNLMTTDEILAEADPDQVVGIYNTIREMSPEIAGDINVMRVLLRSAVQHEGISPFDLKGLLDTELVKQKVDMGQRRMNDHLYKGKPLPSDK